MTKGWIVGFPGYETTYLLHITASTLSSKPHLSFTVRPYPAAKASKKPITTPSILDLAFTQLTETFHYSFEMFKASLDHEVLGSSLIETIRSMLERYKGHSDPYDIIANDMYILTRVSMDPELCSVTMLEQLLAYIPSFLSENVASPMFIEEAYTFVCLQGLLLPKSLLPEHMAKVLEGNPLRFWRVGGEMEQDAVSVSTAFRFLTKPCLATFRVQSFVDFASQLRVEVETVSPDEAISVGRPISFAQTRA